MRKPELRFPEFTEEWEEVILRDVLKRVSIPVDVDKDTSYKQIGIRSHGKGLFYKEDVTGKELGNKRVFWIEPDCLVLNIVFAWERAVARTTQNEVGLIASHRFPMYKTADDKLDLDYAVQYLTTKKGSNILILASPGGAGRNKTLGQEAFLKSRMLLPNIAEQKKIVELLTAVNDLIAVEQKQVLLWEEKKKCVMQMIFSQEIRFKNDDGSDYPEWKKSDFYDIFDILQNNTFSRELLNYSGEGVFNIHYGDVLVKYGSVIDGDKNTMPNINMDISLDRFLSESYLKDGDIILSDTAEDFTAGKVSEIYNVGEKKMLAGLHTMLCRPKIKFSPKYLGYYMNSTQYHRQIERFLVGTKVYSINKKAIGLTKLRYPCLAEQKKIANSLSSIDDVIRIKWQKIETWKNIKNGLLQQVFI